MSVLEMTAAEYHADPADTPSLSASIARILLSQSPRHAWTAHPRLNPDYVPAEAEKFDIGTVAHDLLLKGPGCVQVVPADDWRTNAAKDARDEARVAGRVPLLEKHWGMVQAMVEAAAAQLSQVQVRPMPFTGGKAEQTLIWGEGGVACRARLDHLRDDFTAITDYKTTSRSANPEQWSRTMFSAGYDVQAAWYLRGVDHVARLRERPTFTFVVQETFPPYALSVVSLAPDALDLANAKVDRALTIWKQCLEDDVWPAYPTEVCWAHPPAWAEAEFLAREEVAA